VKDATEQWNVRIPIPLRDELLLVKDKHPKLLRRKSDVAIYVLERGLDAIAQEITETSGVQKAVAETAVDLAQIRESMVTVLALLNSAPAAVIDRSQVAQRRAEVEEALKNKGEKQ
jgi:hypothetical protein